MRVRYTRDLILVVDCWATEPGTDGQHELSSLINVALNRERDYGSTIIHINTGHTPTDQIATQDDPCYTHSGSKEFIGQIRPDQYDHLYIIGFHYNSCLHQMYLDLLEQGVDPARIAIVINLTLPYTKTDSPMSPWVLPSANVRHVVWSEQGFDPVYFEASPRFTA